MKIESSKPGDTEPMSFSDALLVWQPDGGAVQKIRATSGHVHKTWRKSNQIHVFFCVRHGVGMSLRLEENTLFGGHALCGQKGVTFERLYKIRQYIALKNAA